jgi:hypothetical protein
MSRSARERAVDPPEPIGQPPTDAGDTEGGGQIAWVCRDEDVVVDLGEYQRLVESMADHANGESA